MNIAIYIHTHMHINIYKHADINVVYRSKILGGIFNLVKVSSANIF